MKVKFSVLVFALSLLFFSCSNAVQEETSISVDAGQLARFLTKNADYSSRSSSANYRSADDWAYVSYYGMKIKLSTSGSYNASAEVTYKISLTEMDNNPEVSLENLIKKAAGKQITIEGIPVGARIKVKASLSMGFNIDRELLEKLMRQDDPDNPDIDIIIQEELARREEEIEEMKQNLGMPDSVIEGSSSEFTVKRGENRVKIRLGETEFQMLLYTKTNSGYNISTMTEDGTKTILLEGANSNSPLSICYDNSGHMYLYFIDSYNSSLIYSNKPSFSHDMISLKQANKTFWLDGFTYDSATEEFYGYKLASGDFDIVRLNNLERGRSLGEDPGDYDFYRVEGFDHSGDNANMKYKYKLVINDGNVYLIEEKHIGTNPAPDNDVFYTFNLADADADDTITLTDDNKKDVNIEMYIGDISWPLVIKDMLYYEGKVIVLGQVQHPYVMASDPYYSGEILLIDADSFAVEEKLGPGSHTIYSNAEGYFSVYQPDSIKSKNALFSPSKIIGIKPKKLIIADDGIFIYSNGDNIPTTFSNVNRIVTVELDHFTIENVKIITDEAFDADPGSLGFSTTPWSDTIYSDN